MPKDQSTRLNLLRSAPLNKWVALSEDETRIVAIGENYGEVAQRSDEAGVPDPVILKTPAIWAPLFV